MEIKSIQPEEERPTSIKFILQSTQEKFIWLAIFGAAVLFVSFKFLYPFIDSTDDSVVYIIGAITNSSVGMRPIGYSKFLHIFRIFTTSDILLTSFQYIMLETAALYFFFTIQYWFRPRRGVSISIFIFLLYNPASLFMANYVGSDALFAALSIGWFTHLYWITNRPHLYDGAISALLLLCLLAFRYSALYYPIVATIAFLLSKLELWKKILSICLSLLVTIGFIAWVRNETFKETGTRVFSAFSGWQLASNTMCFYPEVQVTKKDLPTRDCRELNSFVKEFFDSSKLKGITPLGIRYFFWDRASPLTKYGQMYTAKYHLTSYAKGWTALGPVLSQYGTELIRNHPLAFARYYCWPNTKEYILPSLEIFHAYCWGQDTIHPIVQNWFRYPTNHVASLFKSKQVILLAPLVILFGISFLFFLAGLAILILSVRRKLTERNLYYTLLLSGIFGMINFGFSVFSAPVVYRYQYFPMAVYVPCTLIIACLLFPAGNLQGKK